MRVLAKITLVSFLALTLISCALPHPPPRTYTESELLQGKRDFDAGYYKRAMRELLPLACEGNPEAQYAVGYMYYYGLGVAQDTDVGYFWIKRAADQNYRPAIKALELITQNANDFKPRNRYR